MGQTPRLEDVISAALATESESHYTSVPGKITSYDPVTQLASVRIMINGPITQPDGSTVQQWPTLVGVPVMFPGSGKFRITFPVNTGDHVLLIVSTFFLMDWLKVGSEVDDDSHPLARNQLMCGFAIPGLFPALKTKPPLASQTEIVVHNDNKDIKLGTHASEYVATEGTMDTFLSALDQAITTLGGPSNPAASQLAALRTQLTTFNWPQNHVSTKVKVE